MNDYNIYPDGQYDEVLDAVRNEIKRAITKHPSSVPFRSRHEAYAVLLEEVDEVWSEIKADSPIENVVEELIQVAAMAVRFAAEYGKYPYKKVQKIPTHL